MARRNKKSAKELLATATRPQRVVTINTNGALLARHQELESELAEIANNEDRARLAGKPEAVKIAEKIQQLEVESEDFLLDLTLQALESKDWRKQMIAHPPTDDQKKDNYVVDLPGLARDTLSECCIDPQLDAEDVANIEKLSLAQFNLIASAIWAVNGGDNAVPFSQIGSAYLQVSDDESKSQEPGESPSAGSKDGSPVSGSRSKPATKKASRLAG